MSVQALTAVLEHSESTESSRCVAIAIANHADVYGLCWPGHDTLAHEARCSPRTSIRAIQDLRDRKELDVYKRKGESNVYRLRLPGLRPWNAEAQQRLEDLHATRDNLSPPTRDNLSPPTRDNLSPPTHDNLSPVTPDVTRTVIDIDTSSSDLSNERSKNKAVAIAQAHIQPLVAVVSDGYGYDLRVEFETVWTRAIADAERQGVNPKAVGIQIAGMYAHALTDEWPDFGLVGRLVGHYGKLALRGIEAAYLRAIDQDQDSRNWIRYASGTCKRIYEENARD